jgi:hypothetical protein
MSGIRWAFFPNTGEGHPMQIHAIHINHLLSFGTFAWKGLDPHLNVIVGPNGAGKTNLFPLLAGGARRAELRTSPSHCALGQHRTSGHGCRYDHCRTGPPVHDSPGKGSLVCVSGGGALRPAADPADDDIGNAAQPGPRWPDTKLHPVIE